jgi:hypothetical protein
MELEVMLALRLKIALSTTFRSNKKQIPKSDAVKL